MPGWGYTELYRPNEEPNNGWENYGTLDKFVQAEYIEVKDPETFTGMQEFGWYFLPHNCAKEGAKCNLHVAIHGCGGGSREVYMENEGRYWGKYAATNDFVLLFPMANNCWDTIGETGESWDNRNGIQPKAIMNMIDRMIEPTTTKKEPTETSFLQ